MSKKIEEKKTDVAKKQTKSKTEEIIKNTERTSDTQHKNYLSNWNEIINKLKQNGKVILYTNLLNTKAKEINDMTIGIEFLSGLTSFGKTIIEKPENMKELELILSTECGKPMNIKLLDEKKDKKQQENIGLDIPINIIEE